MIDELLHSLAECAQIGRFLLEAAKVLYSLCRRRKAQRTERKGEMDDKAPENR